MPSSFEAFHARFRARLRILRQERGLRQQDLDGPALSEAVYRQVELGIREPKLSTIFKIAAALGVHPRDLLDVDNVDPRAARVGRGGARTKGAPASRIRSR